MLYQRKPVFVEALLFTELVSIGVAAKTPLSLALDSGSTLPTNFDVWGYTAEAQVDGSYRLISKPDSPTVNIAMPMGSVLIRNSEGTLFVSSQEDFNSIYSIDPSGMPFDQQPWDFAGPKAVKEILEHSIKQNPERANLFITLFSDDGASLGSFIVSRNQQLSPTVVIGSLERTKHDTLADFNQRVAAAQAAQAQQIAKAMQDAMQAQAATASDQAAPDTDQATASDTQASAG